MAPCLCLSGVPTIFSDLFRTLRISPFSVAAARVPLPRCESQLVPVLSGFPLSFFFSFFSFSVSFFPSCHPLPPLTMGYLTLRVRSLCMPYGLTTQFGTKPQDSISESNPLVPILAYYLTTHFRSLLTLILPSISD